MPDIPGGTEMLRRIVNSSPDCVKLLGLDATLLWISKPGRCAMQLEDSQDITGAAWLEFWKGEHRARAEAAVATAVAGGTGHFTGFCPTAKGAPRWWDVIVTALLGADGQPGQLLSVSRDISGHKHVEEKLQLRQRRLDDAQRVAQMGSWELQVASGQIESSPELIRILGLHLEAAPNYQEVLRLIHADDVASAQAAIAGAFIDHQPFEIEFRVVHQGGGIRTLATRGEVLLNPQGQAESIVGVCHDVTERKRSERMDAGHREILAGIATQRPLGETLERIARLHEEINPGSLCSLLLLDEGGHLLHGAAPSLPEAYSQALHGLEIGDQRGSCGTAAWRGERVLVADIASHPYWINYRDLALAHGLRACWSTPVLGSDGQVLGTFAVYYVEARDPAADELEGIEKLLAVTSIAIESARLVDRLRERDRFFDLSQEIFCIYDPHAERYVQVNPAFTNITGYSNADMTSRHIQDFIHPDDRDMVAAAVRRLISPGNDLHGFVNRSLCRDGSYRWLQWESRTAPDGLVYAVAHDITERRRVEVELDYAARHDPVTGLPHHLDFEQVLASQLENEAKPVWVLFIGLDHFQDINESMGHDIGDAVLQRVAGRLHAVLGDAGELARFAGDEFVIAATGTEQASMLVLAERLRAAVALPIESGDYRLLLTASIGISHSPEHGRTPQDVLRRAEAAMSQAKRQGRDCIREYSSGQMQETDDRLVLGRHLRMAIQRGELELHYQPQHDASIPGLSGFEALLRWNCETIGRVPPSRFIPVAEALGLMPEIGAWVVDEACRQARIWLDRGHSGFNIAINVAAQQLQQQRPGLVAQVRAALERHGVPPEVLTIELTESSLMENVVRVRGTLQELKALGIKLSLDDFGTGYSSLAYLKHFPIDKLKIDQSFVRGLPEDTDDASIARTIVAMGHQLRMVVSAEGVETQSQAKFLKGIGCDELQGYLLGHPVAAGEAEAYFQH